jgi:DNA-binding NarL/FixJ family response regulator
LTFVRSYGLATLGMTLAGQRRFLEADAVLGDAAAVAREQGNAHAECNAYAIFLRSLIQQGRVEEALALPEPMADVPGKGMLGEVLATKALTSACAGRLEEAVALCARARLTTSAIETRVLVPAVEAIVALQTKSRDGPRLALYLVAETESSAAVDLLVTAYRASGQLFAVLMSIDECRERLWTVLSLVHDEWLAEAIGHTAPGTGDRAALLTKREREVYELLCNGLTNRQIAACLVISEETVKLHVHHVYDKLGQRSRTVLMVEAARAKAQAAPRSASTESGSGTSAA